jgi:hypothetical protein
MKHFTERERLDGEFAMLKLTGPAKEYYRWKSPLDVFKTYSGLYYTEGSRYIKDAHGPYTLEQLQEEFAALSHAGQETEHPDGRKNWIINTVDTGDQRWFGVQTFYGTEEEMKKALLQVAADYYCAEFTDPDISVELHVEEKNGKFRVHDEHNDYDLIYFAYEPEQAQELSRDILNRELPEFVNRETGEDIER